jgi:hypothetical protein
LYFGGLKDGTNLAGGIINWCKIWKDDLGDYNCKQLVNWYPEIMRMNYCGLITDGARDYPSNKNYPLTEDETRHCAGSFIAEYHLSWKKLMQMNQYYGNSGYPSDGGYANGINYYEMTKADGT